MHAAHLSEVQATVRRLQVEFYGLALMCHAQGLLCMA